VKLIKPCANDRRRFDRDRKLDRIKLHAALESAQNRITPLQDNVVIAAHFYPQPKPPDAIGQDDVETDLV
jgi:hypothetical protein